MIGKSQQQSVDRLKQFWQWWLDELSQVVPTVVRQYFTRQSSTLRIRVEGNITRFQLLHQEGERLLGAVDLLGCSEQALQTFARESLGGLPPGLVVEVYLSPDQLLTSQQFLPLATEANLADVLSFEIDRLTPFPREQVVFGHRVVGRYPEREKIQVSFHALPRDVLDRLLGRLASLGLQPAGVFPDQSESLPGLNLLPFAERPSEEPLWNGRAKQLGALVLALAVAVLLFPLFQLDRQIDQLSRQVDAIRAEAMVVGEKQSLLASRLAAQDTLVMRKNHSPSKLSTLQEITQRMPDNTWVSRLRVDVDGINLQGESRKASDLIELLEQSEQFQNVQFVSPITANPSTNMERYEINMELAGGAR